MNRKSGFGGNSIFERIPGAPDFARCAPVRKYKLCGYLCFLVKDPPSMSKRIAPNIPRIDFTFAMVVIGIDKQVKIIVTGELPNASLLMAKMMGIASRNAAAVFLCVIDENGERENLGKYEGLDDESRFSAISLAVVASRLGITSGTAYSQDEKGDVDIGAESRADSSSADQDSTEDQNCSGGEYEFDDSLDEELAPSDSSIGFHCALEDFRADADTSRASAMQLGAYEKQSSAIVFALQLLAGRGTGHLRDDLQHAVDDARVDCNIVYTAQLQSIVDGQRSSNILEMFLPLVKNELGNLARLSREILQAESQDDLTLAYASIAKIVRVFESIIGSPPPVDSLNPTTLLEAMNLIVCEAEEARADAETKLAYELQCKIDASLKWLVAAKLLSDSRP